jgi:hypothetical protein
MDGSQCCIQPVPVACRPVFHNPVQEADLVVRRPILPALLRAVRAAEADDQFDSIHRLTRLLQLIEAENC